ncbi:vitamin B12-dependent ribonucleotide reductase [Candidatus Saccharibacteria bacterium]|nr:vitamin B12-dependent ribonucleotide reductase [Candidatus Saccharibacteria bacterium]MCB9834986.1 vitamin B12-dependent ribonucleotide reductase [Candidatus Nomurabacteria bacterium]
MSATTTNSEGLVYHRKFSPSLDPYAEIETEVRDVVLKNFMTKEVVFEQRGIEVPASWSDNALSIFAQHYLRGRLDTPERETSVLESIDRVVDTIVKWGLKGRETDYNGDKFELPDYAKVKPLFADQASAENFAADLKYLIVTQQVNFNSPVWYNIGVEGTPQQSSACFILEVEDNMASILNWYREEGTVFKGGSGAGVNLSKIRSSYEGITKGGKASGPCSYMRAADASAGTMASGGRTRRAAKMVVLDIDHPDIYEQADGSEGFIQLKVKAEEVARTLAQNGFRVSVADNRDGYHIQFQNANNSVRISNQFMETLLEDGIWKTKARKPNLIWKETPSYQATDLWAKIAKAAWECADPGLQFDTTVNFWHTTPAAGRINGSNPCSEYMHLDNSPCNLAATNLLKFLNQDGSWDQEGFVGAVEVVAIAQTIMAKYGDYPTENIARVARGFLQIGQGYTNLGAMLMASGYGYDSMEGRAWAAVITAQMQAQIYQTSSTIARVWGSYPGDPEMGRPGFEDPENKLAHMKVAKLHRDYADAIGAEPSAQAQANSIKFGPDNHIDIFYNEIVGAGLPVAEDPHLAKAWEQAKQAWGQAVELGEIYGYSNAHMSVLAPMGTSGFMMDNDTTGVEPDLALKKNKQKVSGDEMIIVNQTVERALRRLGYTATQIGDIIAYVEDNSSIVGAPAVKETDYLVFDTAFQEAIGGRYLSIYAHEAMMAAVQPFLSGAISKTVNMPEVATVEDVEKAHFDAWRLGLKAVAIYRNNSKATQPMSSSKKEKSDGNQPTQKDTAQVARHAPVTNRVKLPSTRDSKTFALKVNGFKVYVTVGMYPDGTPGEIFIGGGKQGSTFSGFVDALAIAMSMGLQHGVPLDAFVSKFVNMEFEPKGFANSDNFTFVSSVMDLIARELAVNFLPADKRHSLGIKTNAEKEADLAGVAPGQGQLIPDLADTKIEQSKSEVEPENTETKQEVEPQLKKSTAYKGPIDESPLCSNCGIPMTKTGTCAVCEQCGQTSGCS